MKNGILFTADLHLRDTTPTCRIDNFEKTQWEKLRQIAYMVEKENLYWVDCGDIFHKAQPSYRLVNRFIEYMNFLDVQIDAAICGNHDMPNHSFSQIDNSAFGTLLASRVIKKWAFGRFIDLEIGDNHYIINGVNYTEKPYAPTEYDDKHFKNILIMHDMFFENAKNTIPNVDGYLADDFVREWGKCYQYIFTGHNHKSFHNKQLYNVGCMTRQTADMANHRPSVCVLDEHGVTIRYLSDIDKKTVSQAHLDKQATHEEQISSFVESLENVEDASLSFERNVQTVISKVKPENEVKQKVQGAME